MILSYSPWLMRYAYLSWLISWWLQLKSFKFILICVVFTRLKGRRAEALQALRWLRGKEFDVEPELNKLEKSVEVEMATVTHASDLLKPWAYKPILTALGLMSFQQIIGINAALFNAVDIFTAAKSDLDGLVSAILLNGIQVTPSPYSPPLFPPAPSSLCNLLFIPADCNWNS